MPGRKHSREDGKDRAAEHERLAELARAFRGEFGRAHELMVRAPGRVNLIGEHIDYNGGLVLPIAIDRDVTILASRRSDLLFRLRSRQLDEPYDGPCPSVALERPRWANYIFGVLCELERAGVVSPGFDALVDGALPVASGLSSSAALEVATAWLVQSACGTSLDRMALAQLARRAENSFVGVSCGLMDQAIAALGEAGTALKLDCAVPAGECVPIAFAGRARFLIAHSGVRRGLSASAYNERCRQCADALALINERSAARLPHLCAVAPATLEALTDALPPLLHRRARHVVSEQARVHAAVTAMACSDLATFGALLNGSHVSLAEDYEVSCPELDDLTAFLRAQPGVFGTRLTGAGFGGCTVSLVAEEHADAVLHALVHRFYEARGIEPLAFYSAACAGATTLEHAEDTAEPLRRPSQ